MLLNWNAVTPQGPDPSKELASVTGLLSALADRRVRAAQAQAQQEMAEREFQARQANTLADNVRADNQQHMMQKYYDDQLTQQKENQNLIRTQNATSKATYALAEATRAEQAGNHKQAEVLREMARRAYMEVPGQNAPEPTAAPPAASPSFQLTPPGDLRVPSSPSVFPGAAPAGGSPPQAVPGAAPGLPPAPTAQAPAPAAPMAPAGRTLDMSGANHAATVASNLAEFDKMKPIAARSDYHRRAFAEARAKLESGAYNMRQAADDFTKTVARLEGEQGKNNRAAVQAEISKGKGPLPAKREQEVEAEFERSVGRALANKQYGNIIKNDRKLAELARAASGGSDNPALAAMVKGAFVKYAQGGTGVVSDQDMRVFWDKMGGLGVRTMQMLEDIMEGRIYPEKRKMVQAAINEMAEASKVNMRDMGQTIEAALSGTEEGRKRVPRFLQMYARPYYKEWLAERVKNGPQSGGAQVPDFLAEPPQ